MIGQIEKEHFFETRHVGPNRAGITVKDPYSPIVLVHLADPLNHFLVPFVVPMTHV